MHTVEQFISFDPGIRIILVLPGEHHSLWQKLCEEHSFAVSHTLVAGGEERFHSVKAGLDKVKEDLVVGIKEGPGSGVVGHEGVAPGTGQDNPQVVIQDSVSPEAAAVPGDVLIAIHDGVRPLVSHDTIWRCFSDAEEFGNAVPFIEPADSVRVLDGDDSRPVSRSEVRLIQTPQVFRGSVIIKAYESVYDPSFTDDATVAEAAGIKIHLTHGNRENLKITTPEDLAVAATLAGLFRR